MRMLMLVITVAALSSPAMAQNLTLNVSATVSTRCAVINVRPIDGQDGLIQVSASCNASSFQLILGGDLAALPIQSATVEHADIVIRGNTLAVRPDRPGVFSFNVRYDQPLDNARSAVADIRVL